MNQTPRLLNRLVISLLGLMLLAGGLNAVLVASSEGYARGWRNVASDLGAWFDAMLARTTLPGQKDSWLWIVVAALLICAILLMLWWIAVQGRGRGGDYVSRFIPDGAMPGRVEISQSTVEQALRHFLGRRSDMVSINVSVWELEPEVGLRIKVQPRKGTAPGALGRDVARAARLAQDALGVGGPVLIYLVVGTRSRFARTERVL
ncbi:hypothetical protein GCM10009715_38040 [Paeniglutamicibacter psychrophenolicus]|uniref:Alkaline shock response membrane anchor protein AmaP n=1 Tax=Paeniglutamicibacter psychrophenolicus TaxID=257454 RepID=A0ABS4W885_9MICC|nr:hypothetical protein [Paeniglutamicibacter psychrophenolicus]MBP2372407.1 hypothetical protein [Paeniglutamicibacter psychrophenolicus]